MRNAIVTISVRRPKQDITCTVAVGRGRRVCTVCEVLDEDGRAVTLSAAEEAEVLARARAGEDETGR